MRKRLFAFIVIAVIAVVAAIALTPEGRAQTDTAFRFNERNIRAVLRNNSTVIVFQFDKDGKFLQKVRARVSLAWLDPSDRELSKTDVVTILNPSADSYGRNHAEIEIPFPLVKPSIWTRLKYSITPETSDASTADGRPFKPVSGIVSLSRIANHAFELRTTQIGTVQRSHGRFSVFVEAVGTRGGVSFSGITWDAKLGFGDKTLKPAQILTPEDGFAEIIFDFSKETGEADADFIDDDTDEEVTITGRLGDFIQSVKQEVTINSRVSVRFQTDKPIYQPGQTIHIRAILMNQAGRAAENEKVTMRIIRNPYDDDEEVHSAELVSSSFGIVHHDWLIPDAAQHGNYEISLDLRDETAAERHTVRVSRYELPTFSVDVKTDRTAYLPGEQPEITITGTYLFGKPVPNGKVKIARMGAIRWWYDDDQDEDEIVAEGVADEQGVFTARINIVENTRYFSDLPFVAYYYDETSGRTEQRRFDIRITRQPIHIYLLGNDEGGMLPYPLYVITYYADGSPAQTSLEIWFRNRLIKARTNRNGLAKVLLPDSENDDRLDEILEITATDDAGQSGTVKTTAFRKGRLPFRLETERTIYRTGEDVTLRIVSPERTPYENETVVVHAFSESTWYDEHHSYRDVTNIASRVVQLDGYEGKVTFPWQPEFQRTVIFTVWEKSAESGSDLLGAKTVIFPEGAELKINAVSDRAEYRPGDDAVLNIQAASADGRSVKAALGVVIVDQAVFERARTDSDFGGRQSWAYRDSTEYEIAGIRISDIYTLKPDASITPELDLIAEALAAAKFTIEPFYLSFDSSESETLSSPPQFTVNVSQMKKLEAGMKDSMSELGDFWDADDMTSILGSKWSDLRDPWGEPYRMESEYSGTHTVSVWSNGPDKSKDGGDDFSVLSIKRDYFLSTKHMIQNALDKQDYPATAAEFFEILHKNGYTPDVLWDPWGTPYEVAVQTFKTKRTIRIRSAGADGKFGTKDDVFMAEFSGGYFSKEADGIREALEKATSPPQTVEEFKEVLLAAGIDTSRILDAWGRPYKIVSSIRERPRYENVQIYGQTEWSRTSSTVQGFMNFYFHSNGANLNDTQDNFDIARFSVDIKEEPSQEATRPVEMTVYQSGNSVNFKNCAADSCSRLYGTVTDPSDGVIAGVDVVVINIDTGAETSVKTNADGVYSIPSLPDGIYALRVTAPGFIDARITEIRVRGGQNTQCNVQLQLAVTSAEIEVTSTAETTILESGASTGTTEFSPSIHTPRVREYFPETLLWIPELITNKNGTASTRVKLADTITTWKLAVVASTQDGRIAETESDFRTFQPFFLEFNPPQTLTVGDEVTLPVTVRNYLDKTQKTEIRVAQNDWSEILDGGTQTIDVPEGGSLNAAFTLLAKSSTDKAAQRIIARTGRDGDAIEKSLRVHPDAQEAAQIHGDMDIGAISFNISIPQDVISGATRGELKIYPNISSVLFESVSAMLKEPTGCGEQTASGGYANLIALRFARSVGIRDEKIEKNALDNIRKAVDRLKNFSKNDGGVGLYQHYEPEAVLTAHVLSFLAEAAKFAPINPGDISSKISWLEKHRDDWMPSGVKNRNPSRVASIARALAIADREGFGVQPDIIKAAYDYSLPDGVNSYDDSYALAGFITAAVGSGDDQRIKTAVTRLASLAREERGGVYWQINDSSPFYGWGRAGSYEATGLAVSALSTWRAGHPEAAKDIDSLIRRGTLFLLRERDRNGYWRSTQATLQAMRAVADASAVLGGFGNPDGNVEIRVHGKRVKIIAVDPNMRDPVVIDMSSFLTKGDNPITITPSKEGALTTILFSSSHWLPWEKTRARTSPELRLDVRFDKTKTIVGEQASCFVKAERTGSRSHGMMIASIGLPPGAEVDRASLQKLINGGSGVDRYEVLPDRVIFYLWPSKGISTFQFNLSQRFPMNAKSEPSILYDYYNPDALSEVPPFRWVVK